MVIKFFPYKIYFLCFHPIYKHRQSFNIFTKTNTKYSHISHYPPIPPLFLVDYMYCCHLFLPFYYTDYTTQEDINININLNYTFILNPNSYHSLFLSLPSILLPGFPLCLSIFLWTDHCRGVHEGPLPFPGPLGYSYPTSPRIDHLNTHLLSL